MAAIFLSDAHLKSKEDQGYFNLINFLDLFKSEEAEVPGKQHGHKENILKSVNSRGIEALYILGDFFDFWFSKNECIYPDFKAVVDKLVELKDRGIHIHLCEGNHDFLLENYFMEILGMSISEEWETIYLDGQRVLISHGDTIDKTNKSYLLLRKILRSNAVKLLQKFIPPRILWSIARKSSKISKERTKDFDDQLVEKMHKFALEKFAEGFDAVILGHCHIPILREYRVGGRQKTFATVGDWIEHNSYLYYSNGRFELSYYKP